MADDWDKLALEVKAESEAQSVKRNLSGALDVNPDKQAEINKLSEKSGVPAFSISSPENEAWVKNLTRMNDLKPDELVKTHPMTAKALQDENFAKIAHDDVENIKALEDAFNVIGKDNQSTAEKYGRATVSGAGIGVGMSVQGLGSTAGAVSDSLKQEQATKYSSNLQNVMIGADILNRFMEPIGQKIRKGYENFDVKPDDKTFGMKVAGGVGQIGSQILTYLASGGSYGAAGALNFGAGAQQQADTLDNAKVEDKDTRLAAILAGGAVTSATETIQLGTILKGIPVINKIITKLPDGMVPDIAKSKTALTAIDIGGAGAAEYAQEFAENLAHNIIQMSYDDKAKIMDGLYEDATVAGATGAIARSMILTISGIGKRLSTEEKAREDSQNKLTNIQNLHDAAMKMKTVQRDPKAVRAMVEAANPDARVYIDGGVATTYFQGLDDETRAALTEAIPDIQERISEASMAGTDVMLNRSDYIAYIASNEGGKVVMEHVKFDRPDDLTVAQLTDPDYLQGLYDLAPQDKTPLTDIEAFREELTNKLRDSGRIGTQGIARESVAPLAAFVQTMREVGGSEEVTQSLLQGIDVQGPVSPFKSTLDMTDKTINDMREYKTRTDTLFNAREKSLETRREKAKAKAKAEGRLYVEPKGRSGKAKRHLPVLKYIAQSGGVKIGSPLAGELKNMDVTPKTAPWLFVKEDKKTVTPQGVVTQKALTDLDGIDSQDINETIGLDVFRNSGTSSTDKTGYYVDSREILDAIDSELRGNPVVAEATDPMEAAFEDFNQYLESLGLSLDTATNEQIKKALKNPADFLGEDVAGETVDADGVTYNQAGEVKTDTEAFKKWFGDSKVVDADGKPLVVYHGTDKAFSKVNMKKGAQGLFWFTSDKSAIEAGEVGAAGKGVIMEMYASIKNPAGWNEYDKFGIGELIARGYDGAILPEKDGSFVGFIFEPNQVKSVNNKGSFNPDDNRLLFQAVDEYGMEHRPPSPDSGAPLHDVTGGGDYYPDDFYGPNGLKYYGTGEDVADRESYNVIQSVKNKPNATVTIYRAIPKNLSNSEKLAKVEADMAAYLKRGTLPKDAITSDGSAWYDKAYEIRDSLRSKPDEKIEKIEINSGDWVTLSKKYAKDHGESALNGDYKIISKKVKAKELFTNGDSLNEFGYWKDGQVFKQDARGQVSIMRDGRYVVKLFGNSNLSTFLHETGHIFLDAYNRYAEAPDAPKRITDDMAGILEYLGVKSYAEVGVEQHEKFARAFENYLRAGDAPSIALQSAFQKFKAWLSRIYQTIQELRAPVTPELKAIFDRMLATDAEIAMVQSKNDGLSLNDDVLGILPKDAQERYKRLHEKALENAKENLLKKALKQKGREQTQAWKDEREKVRAEIELQVNTDPVYRTIQFLKNGKYHDGDAWAELPPVKLSRDDAIKHVGKTIMDEKMKGMTAKNGMPADMLAQMMGYNVGNGEQGYRTGTGYELLYSIANAEDRKSRIDRLTNETMVERHGDLLTDGSIEKEAIEAWNNDFQAMKMEMEGKAAAEIAKLPFGSNTNFELAAQKILASKNVRDATNVDRFYLASVRAAKAYGKAIRSKNYPVAVKAKQQQLLSHHLYKQSLQARRVLDKSMASWKRLQKPDEKLSKSMDINYIYVARAILGRYGVLPYNPANLQTYFEYIREENPEAFEDLMLAVQENTKSVPDAETRDVEYTKGKLAGRTVTQTFQPWTKLSLEEFMALKDTVDNVLGVGRNQKMMTIDGEKIERQLVLDELQARLDELPETSIATGQQKALEWHDNGKLALSGIKAGLRRVENWTDVMDGRYGGVFRKYIWNPINDARGNYLVAKHEYLTKMAELLKPHDALLNDSGAIYAEEINYTFGSKAELVGMILHMGNESNWYKLWKGGRGRSWNPENVQAMMSRMMNDGTIVKEDMDLVQSMWDLVDKLKPDAQKAHKAMYGYNFAEITAWPVPTPWGEYRGGYWPAIADNTLSQDARIRQDKEDLITVNNSSMFPSTGRGFTKSREEGYAAPLSFDLRLLPSHVDKVLRFVHLEPAVKDVAKLVNDKKFRVAMDRIDPRAIESMIIPWLQRSARQTVETSGSKWLQGAEKVSRFLRSSASAQTMMLNFLNAIQQVTGFAPAMYKVGARPMGRAFVQYLKNPQKAHEKIYEASAFMRYRNTILADNMQKTVIDIVLDTSKYAKVKDAAHAHGYIFQKVFQSWVDGTTWMAAYDNAVSKGMNEKDSVRYADSMVRETQGSTSATDISGFEAGSPHARLFTMFYSYFNTQANLITTEAQNIIRSTSGLDRTKKLGYLYLMAYAIPSFMAEFIVKSIKGDLPDDEDDDGSELDDWLAWFAGSQIRYATAMVPFVGQVANSIIGQYDDKPYNDRMSLSPVVNMVETLARTPKSIYQAVNDDGDVSRAIQNTLTSLGFVTGLPLGQLGKPLGYAADVAEGDTEIDSPLDPIRGIISGPPPADKQ